MPFLLKNQCKNGRITYYRVKRKGVSHNQLKSQHTFFIFLPLVS